MDSKKIVYWFMTVIGFLMFAVGVFSNLVSWISPHTQIIFVSMGLLFLALGVMNLKKSSQK